jgi:hypothetical protein
MSDNLRTRIAAAIKAADKRVAGFISYEERADAVIAELGLTRVTRSERVPIHRYVTDWKADA